ncbi:MAG: discoidin domain-containing protein [Planctomycetes bacterium]|nr:discoidin domain-containing protein [Planctomycetota bacterium]
MCKRSIHRICIVLVLALAGSASAELVLHLPFDEGSGNVTADISASGLQVTLERDFQWTAGIFGQAVAFTDGFAEVSDPLNLPQITILAWVNPTSILPQRAPNWFSGQNTIYGKGGDGADDCIALSLTAGDGVYLYLDTGVNNFLYAEDAGVQLGQWQHIAATFDGTIMRVFLNGEQVGELAAVGSDSIIETIEFVRIGGNRDHGTMDFDGAIDDVKVFDQALTTDEIQQAMNVAPGVAANPDPANEAIDVLREAALNWTSGDFANTHDVYFGTVFGDVNDASANDPLDVLVSQGQTTTTFDAGVLDFGQTYYWRVDEVNAAPDNTIFPGDVWSFEVEPISIPITNIIATASGFNPGMEPSKTIDGSGLNESDQHSTMNTGMWLAIANGSWIQYEFDRAYKLHELLVWNSNQNIEAFLGFGVKEAVIETSMDGDVWTEVQGVPQFAQAPGQDAYQANTTVDLSGIIAKYVRISPQSAYGFTGQIGLSEVRFFSIPVNAREPQPASGSADVDQSALLSWRAGREAGGHDIYLGSDATDLPLVGSVTQSSFAPESLDLQLGQTYHWRVDEVNEAMDPSTWTGEVWSFTTVDAISVDDMESYEDEEFLEIWATWIDGFDDPANGSLVGKGAAFAPETDIVHGGSQSLPMNYDNRSAAQSEATRTFDVPMDWTGHGVQSLVLYFHGSGINTGGTLYVKINDTKVAYDGDASSLMRAGWNKWVILLGDLAGVDLSNVRSLTIGVDGGGDGVVYVDDITLTPAGDRDLITPSEPVGGLLLHLPFDGDYQDASGNGLHGTPMGGASPPFEAGHLGQAVNFDGVDQYVEITGYKGILGPNPFSISAWIKTSGNGTMVGWGSTAAGVTRVEFRVDQNRLRCESSGNVQGDTTLPDSEWIHVAVTVIENASIDDPDVLLYLNGQVDNRTSTGAAAPLDMAPGFDVTIGRRHSGQQRWFFGSMDEVRIFDRTLSAGEVASLAGRILAFDSP